MFYLNSFYPLCRTKLGRLAMHQHNLPPFIDSSCRREPDFQSPFPSISAICRGNNFAPRLEAGDSVIYVTVKDKYGNNPNGHWQLVAILDVFLRCESHEDAADWYFAQGLSLPSNCMVDGNDCLPYDMTGGTTPQNMFGSANNIPRLLRKWNESYRRRVEQCGVFLICRARFMELYQPLMITEATMMEIFGRIPPTLNPPPIREIEYLALGELTLGLDNRN
jgi:hypothetical protein